MKGTVSYSIILVQDSEFQLRNYVFALSYFVLCTSLTEELQCVVCHVQGSCNVYSACNTVIVLEFDELRFIPFMASVNDCIFVRVNTTQVEFLGNNKVKMAEINTLKRGNKGAVQ